MWINLRGLVPGAPKDGEGKPENKRALVLLLVISAFVILHTLGFLPL